MSVSPLFVPSSAYAAGAKGPWNGNEMKARMGRGTSTAHAKVLNEGLKMPTAIEPAGDVIWITERALGKAASIPLPK